MSLLLPVLTSKRARYDICTSEIATASSWPLGEMASAVAPCAPEGSAWSSAFGSRQPPSRNVGECALPAPPIGIAACMAIPPPARVGTAAEATEVSFCSCS